MYKDFKFMDIEFTSMCNSTLCVLIASYVTKNQIKILVHKIDKNQIPKAVSSTLWECKQLRVAIERQRPRSHYDQLRPSKKTMTFVEHVKRAAVGSKMNMQPVLALLADNL